MSNHLQRIEAVEKELKRLSSTSAVKEDVTKLRAEMKQVYVSPGDSSSTERSADTTCCITYRTVSMSRFWICEHTCGVLSKIFTEALAIVSIRHLIVPRLDF